MNQSRAFYQEMKTKMASYKTKTLGITENGQRRGREYEHILPARLWTLNLWPGTCQGALDYFRKKRIKWHDQKDNLLSSQILCTNLFYSLKNYPSLLDNFMREFYPSLVKVVDVDFECIGQVNYLNEPGGRGYSRTSADVAITWEDTKSNNNLLLVEFKFTEPNFGGCGRSGNKNPNRCNYGEKVISSPKTECYRASPEVNRPYWDMILSPQGPFLVERLKKIEYCPFKYDFYQLMRNQLLAKCIAEDKNSGFCSVDFAVCYDARNETLLTLSHPVDGNDCPFAVWKSFLKNQNSFKHFTIQTLMQYIDFTNTLPNELHRWREYLKEKYSL